MSYNFHILTVTHKTTHTDEIADFIVPTDNKDALAIRLHALRDQYKLGELMYLATCNRVMFFFTGTIRVDNHFIADFFGQVNPNSTTKAPADLRSKVSHFEKNEALKHLYEVAASVDSMVVGEREIFRQMREAYEFCYTENLIGDNIRLAMRSIVETAKEVYAQTRIGEKPVSIVSLAFQKLQATETPLDARFLIVGAGKTNTQLADFILKQGYTNTSVFNRTLENAQILGDKLNAPSFLLSDLENYTKGFDVLVVCTSSVKALITSDLYQKLLQGDTRQKVVIDLSLPQNVDKEVVRQFDVHYIGIEGLRQLAKQNLAFRLSEVNKANTIISKRVQAFNMIYRERQVERAMSHLPKEIKAIKSHAMNNVFKNELDELAPEARELVERMMDYMEKRCIGVPMVAVKDAYKKIHKGIREEMIKRETK